MVRRAETVGLSQLTIRSQQDVQTQLNLAIAEINKRLDEVTRGAINTATDSQTAIDKRFYNETVLAVAPNQVTKSGITALLSGVNRRVVLSLVGRLWGDGYSYSDRVWRSARGFEDKIKRIITEGLARGRDVVKIARDIEVYVKDGAATAAKRWGDLQKDTNEWNRRIGRANVDYNALRLVRTELGASLQDAAAWQGDFNPGANGWYDWVRINTIEWGCECPDLAANGPYRKEDIPARPHPNCLCEIRPQLRDQKEFIGSLKSWASGSSVGYLDEWYRTKYVPAQLPTS